MDRIAKLLSELTLEEKAAMCAGSGPWHSTGVERLRIPPIKVTDGPNGARGDLVSGCTAACFPVGSAMASTWNVALIREVGVALGEEAQSKGAQVLLGPTVNIHRHPLNGRHFECYAEDPHLTSRIAVALIQGLQSQGVGACIKHFVCNDSEFERFTISSRVEDRALREIYLAPFEAAVKEADVWSVMSAYNRINGVYASSHSELLAGVLKEEWGFDGVVISDWGAARETVENANGGLDLAMPGPAPTMQNELLDAVKSGLVDEATLDERIRRLLRLTIRSGRMDEPEERPERANDRPEHRALARRAAAEAIVLVRNEGLLPLDAGSLRRVAVIGPNAAVGRIQGGGSSIVVPHYEVHPLDAIRERLGEGVEVVCETGCFTDKFAPPIDPARLRPPESDGPGLRVEYRNGPGFEGEPLHADMASGSEFVWVSAPGEGIDFGHFSALYLGTFTPDETGPHVFGLRSNGASRIFVDDALVVDNWSDQDPGDSLLGSSSGERRSAVDLVEGRAAAVRIEYQREGAGGFPTLQLGVVPPSRQDRIDAAAELAGSADVAIVVAGTSGEWESEGYDRRGLALPGRQVELIRRVAAANPKTAVVLNVGSPVDLEWIDAVPALLQTWFPGQEFGHALADVLFGDVDPSGRLPTTWPKRLEDTPAYTNYPGESGSVLYGEGLFVGYRWYDARDIEPRLPFGHGLSYTRFEYGDVDLPAQVVRSDAVEVAIDVRNVGDRVGHEVVQLYLRDPQSRLVRPEMELRAFEKVKLEPGATARVRFELNERDLSYWDPEAAGADGVQGAWVAEAGEFEVRVGASSRDIRARGSFSWVDDAGR